MLGCTLILIFFASEAEENSVERFARHTLPDSVEHVSKDNPLGLNDVATYSPKTLMDEDDILTTTETPGLVEELAAESVSSESDEDFTEMPEHDLVNTKERPGKQFIKNIELPTSVSEDERGPLAQLFNFGLQYTDPRLASLYPAQYPQLFADPRLGYVDPRFQAAYSMAQDQEIAKQNQDIEDQIGKNFKLQFEINKPLDILGESVVSDVRQASPEDEDIDLDDNESPEVEGTDPPADKVPQDEVSTEIGFPVNKILLKMASNVCKRLCK